MKTKLIILSSNDIFFTIPLHTHISKDNRIDIQKIYLFKEKSHLKKKLKILILLSFFDLIKILKKIINSLFLKKEIFIYEKFSNVNSINFINNINKLKADLIICINCPQILSKNTINKIKYPIYNFHPGDLPNFRGVFIPFFLLKNKINKACLTFHKIDEQIDKGIVISKNYVNLTNKDNMFSIYEKIFLSNKSINFILSSIINHKSLVYSENNNSDKYYSYPTIIEILKFRFGFN